MLKIIDSCLGGRYHPINISEDDKPDYNNVACVLVDLGNPEPFIKGAHENHTPVIWIVTNFEPAKIEMALQIGCNNYIIKPFHKEELLQKIGEACA